MPTAAREWELFICHACGQIMGEAFEPEGSFCPFECERCGEGSDQIESVHVEEVKEVIA